MVFALENSMDPLVFVKKFDVDEIISVRKPMVRRQFQTKTEGRGIHELSAAWTYPTWLAVEPLGL